MKKAILFMAVLALTVQFGYAQTTHHSHHHKLAAVDSVVVTAPTGVQTAFSQRYAAATSVTWNKSYSGNWTASFLQDSLQTMAQYDSTGNWIATHTQYTPDNVPSNIAQNVRTKFPNASIKDATKVERDNVTAYYKVDVDNQGTELSLLANDKGTVTE